MRRVGVVGTAFLALGVLGWAAELLGPPVEQLNWTNSHGGPIGHPGDPIELIRPAARPPASSPPWAGRTHPAAPEFGYAESAGFLQAGNDLGTVSVSSVSEALAACSAAIMCRGLTYQGGPNGTISGPTTVYLKSGTARSGGAPWASWVKQAPVGPPSQQIQSADDKLVLGLRADSFTVQWLNLSSGVPQRDNFSFVPPLSPGSALPPVQHLGDLNLRVGGSGQWRYYSSAWGPFSAAAAPVPLRPGESAAHDITPLLQATADQPIGLSVRRSYGPMGGAGLAMQFELRNTGPAAVEVGGLGMAVPAAVSQDVHIGRDHGWVEWLRVHVDQQLQLDQECLVATPLHPTGGLENFRPIFEYGGGGFEWTVLSKAWAEEWERNQQWPYLYMSTELNQTGLWPDPRSPWPAWGDGGQTVRTSIGPASHWNPPSSWVLEPDQTEMFGMRLSGCSGGPRTRDQALAAAGEPVLRAVPGYTLSTAMRSAELFVTLPAGLTVTTAVSFPPEVLSIGPLSTRAGVAVVPVVGSAAGRARLEVKLSDGTVAVAHYLVLPPLEQQVSLVAHHWAEVAWLPREFNDPFGRSASVMPWDREDKRHRLNDGRAYGTSCTKPVLSWAVQMSA